MKLTAEQMSSFLMFRLTDPMLLHTVERYYPNRVPIKSSEELEHYLRQRLSGLTSGRIALALSGGIDSAILAKFVPKGTIAYTFKCVVPGVKVTDETQAAAEYARQCGLEHRIVEIYWEDFERYADKLMRNKGGPFHSIEVQIYKAALAAKQDGCDTLVFGESADSVYGGLNGLLSKDWSVGEFIQRYAFLMPYLVLRHPELPIEPIRKWERAGKIDPHEYVSNGFFNESISSYINACQTAGIQIVMPYAETFLAGKIDYDRVRSGDSKYLVREVFRRLYPGFMIPPKTPMPRPMNEWLKNWKGPDSDCFWPNCVEQLTGDQKWLVWILDRFLKLED